MKHSVKKNCVTIMKAVKQIRINSDRVMWQQLLFLYLLKFYMLQFISGMNLSFKTGSNRTEFIAYISDTNVIGKILLKNLMLMCIQTCILFTSRRINLLNNTRDGIYVSSITIDLFQVPYSITVQTTAMINVLPCHK
jgi:hypothetical protein